MRIGLDVTAAVTQGGGIGRHVRELLKALIALDHDSDYRLFWAARAATHPLPELPPNVNATQLPFHDIWLARFWHRLRLPVPVQAITGPLDLFHGPDFLLPPVGGRTRTLVTIHDLSYIYDADNTAPSLRDFLTAQVPRAVRRADHVFATSQHTRRDLLERYGLAEDKVSVLYAGVDPCFAPVIDAAELDAVRQRYGIGPAPFVLSVSTLQPRKNLQRLIAAFDEGLRFSDYKLVLAGGKGWLYDNIFAEVQSRELTDRVIFPGFVDDADLPALYSAAAVLAYPSLYEGFGLPMLEAMACGTPVLTSNTSCLPEVAGGAALLIDPLDVVAMANGLQRLTSEADLRAAVIDAGRKRAARFRWSTTARQVHATYQRLLA